ncbi:uncharacterized protein [Periplaneta americana]|uniref:uncharacterized protein isoform X2 n=1 Tax=Periplaneta americana TaxID=6978 RepID=UPI0037E818D3
MDVVKMEGEIDPLAIEGSNDPDTEQQKPLSEEGNVLDLQVTGIKTECVDHSYDVKTEMAFVETPMSMDFLVMKNEVEEEAVKLELIAEEDEAFTEGIGVPASCDSITEDECVETDPWWWRWCC